jgi:HEPN domain-containing protein
VIPASTLRNIAAARLEDARQLFVAGRFDGAAYLCGYAVELALKARICDTLAWSEFPETAKEFEP